MIVAELVVILCVVVIVALIGFLTAPVWSTFLTNLLKNADAQVERAGETLENVRPSGEKKDDAKN